MSDRCTHIERSGPLFVGHRFGGASLGRCTNKSFPQLIVCFEHSSKDALALLARGLLKEIKFKFGEKDES